MVDQSLVTTGYDMELLIGEKYFKYILLSMCETGTIPNWVETPDPNTGEIIDIIIHRPGELENQRLYQVYDGYQPYPPGVDVIQQNVESAFDVTIIPAFLDVAIISVKIWISKGKKDQPEDMSIAIPLSLNLRIKLVKEPDTNGFDKKVSISFELISIDANFDFLGTTEEQMIQLLTPFVDRTMDLSIGGQQNAIQNINMRTSSPSDSETPVIGFYINLKLRGGPEKDNYLAPRGDYLLAKNFMPEGQTMAFAFSNKLYEELGHDLKFRMAQLKPGTQDQYYYPIMDGKNQIGKIKSVSVIPNSVMRLDNPSTDDPGTGEIKTFTNELVISVHGEYFWSFIDPDFYFKIKLSPKFENGILSWKTSYDLDVGFLDMFEIIFDGVLLFLAVVCPPAIGALLELAIISHKTKEIIIEGAKNEVIAEENGEINDANFMQMLPDKLPIETIRWDPLYNTVHQVVSSITSLTINDKGFSMAGDTLWLGKEVSPVGHVVIRDKIRDSSENISSLIYRVSDYNSATNQFNSSSAAVDRMPWVYIPAGGGEPERVALSLNDSNILARLTTNRLSKDIPYQAKKVDIINHQVFRILLISSREIIEISGPVKKQLSDYLRDIESEFITNTAIGELIQELGHAPTVDQINQRFEQLLGEMVDNKSIPLIEQEVTKHLLLELTANELGKLQLQDIALLEEFDLIKRHRDGNETLYFRDKADSDLENNLMSRPGYISSERHLKIEN